MGLTPDKISDIIEATVKQPWSATGAVTIDVYTDVPSETGFSAQIRGGNAGVGYSDDSLMAPQSALKSGDAFRSWLRSSIAERHLKGTSEESTESTESTESKQNTVAETTAKASQKVKEVVDKTDAVREKSASAGNAVTATGAVPGDSGSVPWFLVALAITALGLIYYGLN